MSQLLQEYCSSRGVTLRIDRDAGLLRGVKLLGLASRNGREYPEATLARAARLYEGAKVNVNHPKGSPHTPRDYQDRLGTIRNVVARPSEGLFGDLQFNPKHALAEQLLWDAEHAPENVGFSHNVQARTGRRGDRGEITVVEEILAVQSVDLVADPATTRGLFESAAASDSDATRRAGDVSPPITHTTTSPGDPIGRLTPAARQETVVESGDASDLCREQATEIDRLRAEITQLQAAQAIAQKRAAIAALLVEHGLPPLDQRDAAAQVIISDSFLESLFAAPDEPAMRALIRDRAALVEQARRWKSDSAAAVGWAERSEAHAQGSQLPVSREQTLV